MEAAGLTRESYFVYAGHEYVEIGNFVHVKIIYKNTSDRRSFGNVYVRSESSLRYTNIISEAKDLYIGDWWDLATQLFDSYEAAYMPAGPILAVLEPMTQLLGVVLPVLDRHVLIESLPRNENVPDEVIGHAPTLRTVYPLKIITKQTKFNQLFF